MDESFTASGGWWDAERRDAEYVRDYSYHDSPAGILWLFVDRTTDTCWVQGEVD